MKKLSDKRNKKELKRRKVRELKARLYSKGIEGIIAFEKIKKKNIVKQMNQGK